MVDILQEGFPALPSPDEHRYPLETQDNIREYLRDLVRALESQFNFQKTDADALNTATAGAITNPMTTRGDLIRGGTTPAGIPTRLALGPANTVLHGGSADPSYSAVVEGDLSLSDNTTNNVSTSKHGLAPKLSNVSTEYLSGTGVYSTPASGDNPYEAALIMQLIFEG